MKVERIALIGYRATGKTSVGRRLAEKLAWQFVDTDALVEQIAGKSIAKIFTDDGESTFRKMEVDAVRESAQRTHCVMSLGGGAVTQEPNRHALEDVFTVWLTASPESIYHRLAQDRATATQRPNLTDQGGLAEVETLLAARSPTYAECADLIVDTENKPLQQVVDEVYSHLE